MRRFALALGSLLAIAVGSGVLWRWELDARGWDGLTWLTYFHWAIPVSVAVFVGWSAVVAPVQGPARRIVLAVLLLVAAPPLYVWTGLTVSLVFASGPSAFALILFDEALGRFSVGLALVPVVPVTVAVAAFAVGVPRIGWRLLVSEALWWAAPVAALVVLRGFPDRGSCDLIHTIKTGWVAPFLVVALGVLMLPSPSDLRG